MTSLESQEENTTRRVLHYNPMSWLGQLRPHHRDETWSDDLWYPFFVTCVGATIPALTELPLSVCGCKKFAIDDLETHDWMDIELTGYLTNTTGPVCLVLDLHITHDRFGSSSDPSIGWVVDGEGGGDLECILEILSS